ncbi:serine hydrolase [Chryseobacterium sp. KACC 21268]|nr:serine hydrolase [Chryseobacterium sp. KACC 21268]
MKKIYFFLIFNIFGFASAQNSDYKKSVDSLMDYLTKENSFLGNIELRKGNEIVYEYNSNPLEPKNGQYRIGSITKIFTAIVIFQLIEENKLTLDTKLIDFYPDIKNAKDITIENLLSHTSGIFNFTAWENYYSTRNQKFSKAQILEIINNGKPEFKPKKDCVYSNSNYTLLGYIIEDLTKKSYTVNVKERIIDKIDLKHTFVAESEQDVNNIKSYLFNGEDWYEDMSSNPSLPFSAGAIVSSTSDLNQLMNQLFHGDLVSKKSLSTMQTLKNKTIGHGFFAAPFYDKICWGHTGRIDEFKSATFYFPAEDLYLSILTNGSRGNLNDVTVGLLSKYYGKKYSYPTFYHSEIYEPKALVFTGTYRAKLAGLITIGEFEITEAKNGYLFMSELQDGKTGERALLERIDANTLYLRSAKGKLIFTLENDKVKKLILEQGKMSIKCKKIK